MIDSATFFLPASFGLPYSTTLAPASDPPPTLKLLRISRFSLTPLSQVHFHTFSSPILHTLYSATQYSAPS
ncbi:hypothetical protein BDW69DRAFT_172485 [Aspergillus filifer]